MKHSYFTRKIDELGRVVLPIEIRQNLDIKEKDPLEITIKDNGIFLQKNHPFCTFCNSNLNLKDFQGKCICENCLNKLKEGDFNE